MTMKMKYKGKFDMTKSILNKHTDISKLLPILNELASEGVTALSAATPKTTGDLASRWGYEIKQTSNSVTIQWTNDDTTKSGTPVVLLVEYGHASRNGTYISGQEFIGEAIKPIFQRIITKVEQAVK